MSDEERETVSDPFHVAGQEHDDRLAELKRKLWGDFGKTTCWQWLCKERDATTVTEQIAVAEEVLAMPPNGERRRRPDVLAEAPGQEYLRLR